MSSSFPQERQRRAGNAPKVLDYFRTHEGVWVGTETLEKLGGRNAWRTRVSDARVIVKAEGGQIENRQHRIVTFDEATGHMTKVVAVISEYQYLSYVPLGRAADVPKPDAWPSFGAPVQEPWRLT